MQITSDHTNKKEDKEKEQKRLLVYASAFQKNTAEKGKKESC